MRTFGHHRGWAWARDIALVHSKLLRFSAFEVMLSSSIGVLAVGSGGRARLIVAGGVENRHPFVSCELPDRMDVADAEQWKGVVDATLLTDGNCARCVVTSFLPTSLVLGTKGSLFVRLRRRRRSLSVQPNTHAAAAPRSSRPVPMVRLSALHEQIFRPVKLLY
jgi:hypothetical protein